MDLQRGDLRVEGPEGRRWGLFFMIQGGELDLDGRAGESERAPATGGEQWIRLRAQGEALSQRGQSTSLLGGACSPLLTAAHSVLEWHSHTLEYKRGSC